jgi:hypothetical protein
MTGTTSLSMRTLIFWLVLAWPFASWSQSSSDSATATPRVMLLGLFHFDNPGGDAVKYEPLDVLRPEPQAYLAGLATRLARFAPTKVVLEYRESRDEVINRQYADFLGGQFDLPKNEIYQIGFRVARLAKLERVHGFDTPAPSKDVKLWGYLGQEPDTEAKLMALIEAESRRLQTLHETKTLKDILVMSNEEEEDLRNKGFYMLLNSVGADQRLFHGADASADWWHRNLRMYALIQRYATPGERVLVIAGSGHTAVIRDFLDADGARVEEDVMGYF